MNLISYSSSKKEAVYALGGSLVLHVILFLLLLGWFALGLTAYRPQAEPESPPQRTVVLSPEFFERTQKPESLRPADPPLKRQFAQTNPLSPERSPARDTALIGERETQAASETVLTEGDPTLPSQITRAESPSQLPNTFDSDYQAENNAAPSSPAPSLSPRDPQSPPPLEAPPRERPDPAAPLRSDSPLPSDRTELPPLPTPPTPPSKQETLAQTPRSLETPPPSQTLSPVAPLPPDDAQSATAPPRPQPPALEKTSDSSASASASALPPPPTAPDRPASSSRYQTESKKTRIVGSLSAKGASSLDVKRTALGAYYGELSKIIEQRWQENCIKYRDHINPGVISLRFLIDKEGKISAPRFHDVVSASEIQKGFTLKSVQRASLPPMPPAVQKELGGEDLELIYNFYF